MMTVYVCCSERDKEYGSPVAQFLRKMDFRVYDRCDAEENGDDVFPERYTEQTRNAIRDAAQHGCFLFLMTCFSRQALMTRRELEFAILEDACVATVLQEKTSAVICRIIVTTTNLNLSGFPQARLSAFFRSSQTR